MTPDKLKKLSETIERLYPLLKKTGQPHEVLPALLFICAEQAQAARASPEVFFVSVLEAVSVVWNESLDPQKMAQAIADWALHDAAEGGGALDAYERALISSIRNSRRGKRKGWS